MNASAHLRGIVIAGGLAALALALGFVTLAMNQTASRAAAHTVLTLKARRAAAEHGSTTTAKPKHVKPKPVDQNFLAAVQAGLPRSVAKALAKSPVVVVELTSKQDPVAKLAFGEAQAGAAAAGASFVSVNIDQDGGAVQVLTRLIGSLPVAPAALVYVRPSTLSITLPGFNDRTTVQQAVMNAAASVPGATLLTGSTDWAKSANALCMQTAAQIVPLVPTMASPATQARVASINASLLAKIRALKPPVGQAAKVKQVNALLAQVLAAGTVAIAAAKAHNSTAAAAALKRAFAYRLQLDPIERELGATSCASAKT